MGNKAYLNEFTWNECGKQWNTLSRFADGPGEGTDVCLLLKWNYWNITNSKCKESVLLREHCHKLNVMSVTTFINKCWIQKFQQK